MAESFAVNSIMLSAKVKNHFINAAFFLSVCKTLNHERLKVILHHKNSEFIKPLESGENRIDLLCLRLF